MTATAQADSAQAGFVAARKVFVVTDKALDMLLTERTALRKEVRRSRTALHRLRQQVEASHDRSAREALRAQIRAERADIRHSTWLLDSQTALRSQARANRLAAMIAFAAARSAREATRNAADAACGGPTPSEPDV